MTAPESSVPDRWMALAGLARLRALRVIAGPAVLALIGCLLFELLALPVLAEAALWAADRAAIDLGLIAVRGMGVALAVLSGAGAGAAGSHEEEVLSLGAHSLGALAATWLTLALGGILFLMATGAHGLPVPSGLGVWLGVTALECLLALAVGLGAGGWLGSVGGGLVGLLWLGLGVVTRALPGGFHVLALLFPDPQPFDVQAVVVHGLPAGPGTLLQPALHAAGWVAIGSGLAVVAWRHRASRRAAGRAARSDAG